MDEFFRIWCKFKSEYDLEREVHKSLHDGFWMKIYRDGRLIIKEKDDDEATLYLYTALALIQYINSHEA